MNTNTNYTTVILIFSANPMEQYSSAKEVIRLYDYDTIPIRLKRNMKTSFKFNVVFDKFLKIYLPRCYKYIILYSL